MDPRPQLSLPLATVLFRREALFFILILCCSLVIFLISLQLILFTIWDRATQLVQQEVEKEADTIARLLVFEFSHLKELETQTEVDRAIEERIKRLLWEKVSFNETIQGIELIHRQADLQGQHLTYTYFPRARRDLEAERGPQKSMKSFSGPERELIQVINQEQRVDRRLLELINQGQKLESQMLLRYFPLHIPLPDRGAVYWGVTKVGINADAMRRFQVLMEAERSRLRQVLAWIMGGVTVLALAVGLLGFRWLSQKSAAPFREYALLNTTLEKSTGVDIESLLNHLKHNESQNIQEVEELRRFGLHLGGAIKVLGERLIAVEPQACVGRLAARLVQTGATGFTGWATLFGLRPQTWQDSDLQPFFEKMSEFLVLVLPPGAALEEERQSLPSMYSCEAHMVQAVLLVADFALEEMEPAGVLTWQVRSIPSGGFHLGLSFTGRDFQPEEISRLLRPFHAGSSTLPPLGPFLAAALAEQHGGRLEVQPHPGGGLHLSLEFVAGPVSGDNSKTVEVIGA